MFEKRESGLHNREISDTEDNIGFIVREAA